MLRVIQEIQLLTYDGDTEVALDSAARIMAVTESSFGPVLVVDAPAMPDDVVSVQVLMRVAQGKTTPDTHTYLGSVRSSLTYGASLLHVFVPTEAMR